MTKAQAAAAKDSNTPRIIILCSAYISASHEAFLLSCVP